MKQSLNIALIGYGKMGKELEKAAAERGHHTVVIIDTPEDWQTADFSSVDVALEFSTPKTALQNILQCFEKHIPVVCGTTAWHEHLDRVKEQCLSRNQSFFFGSNFSLSVNIFFEINRLLARLMNNQKEYTVDIEEIHHTTKLDAPSGTAIVLANDIIQNMEHLDTWSKEKTTDKELEIRSLREENVPGTHIITYESGFDQIQIQHTAKSRKGFAIGAILAAEWLYGKKGFFEMKDLLNLKPY